MIKTINIIIFIMTFLYFLAGQLSYSKDSKDIDPSTKFENTLVSDDPKKDTATNINTGGYENSTKTYTLFFVVIGAVIIMNFILYNCNLNHILGGIFDSYVYTFMFCFNLMFILYLPDSVWPDTCIYVFSLLFILLFNLYCMSPNSGIQKFKDIWYFICKGIYSHQLPLYYNFIIYVIILFILIIVFLIPFNHFTGSPSLVNRNTSISVSVFTGFLVIIYIFLILYPINGVETCKLLFGI